MVTCQLVTNTFHEHKLKPGCLLLAHKTFTTNLAMRYGGEIFCTSAQAHCY